MVNIRKDLVKRESIILKHLIRLSLVTGMDYMWDHHFYDERFAAQGKLHAYKIIIIIFIVIIIILYNDIVIGLLIIIIIIMFVIIMIFMIMIIMIMIIIVYIFVYIRRTRY